MKILIIGGGGREHALVWKLLQSTEVKKIYCAPGNAGIAQLAECLPIEANDIASQLEIAKRHKIDLVVVGPEAPLVAGLVNVFNAAEIPVFGPTKAAAKIEGSKIFCKEFLRRHNIPTADFAVFDDPEKAADFLLNYQNYPVVIKADGLTGGKGVFIARQFTEALVTVSDFMTRKKHGEAGSRIIVEEFLRGKECSLIFLTDGENIIPLIPARDYKRLRDNDQGPNTGGMGSYSPIPDVSEDLVRKVIEMIIRPTLTGLANEGCSYHGALYAGLMITAEGPRVLEFNCRFGDPETQVILPLLKADLVEMMLACLDGSLNQVKARWSTEKTVGVVLASKGYPYKYKTGYTIHGLENNIENTLIFQAGTSSWHDEITTNGGRVLSVVGLGSTYEAARETAYQRIETIKFDDMIFRKDIALF